MKKACVMPEMLCEASVISNNVHDDKNLDSKHDNVSERDVGLGTLFYKGISESGGKIHDDRYSNDNGRCSERSEELALHTVPATFDVS